MRRRVAWAVAVAVLVAAAAATLLHDALAATLVRMAGAALGYRVSFDRLAVGLDGATITLPRLDNRAGEPVFQADRLALRYALRDFLPGSRRLFWISALDVTRPQITLIHNADGTYNIPLPAKQTANAPPPAPLNLRARVRDGSIVLIDRYVVPGEERRQRIVGIAVDAALAPNVRSYYDVRFDLDDGRTRHPVRGKAIFDDARGFEFQHWTAPLLPIGPLVNFALPSHAINLVDGALRDVDLRLAAIVEPSGQKHPSLSARAQLERGKLYAAGLTAPIRDAHGPLLAYEDGITTRGIDATLGGVPIHFAGGVFGGGDVPHVQFAIYGRGALERLRRIAAAAERQPLAGDLTFALQVGGPLAEPLVTGQFHAPSISYGNFRFDAPRGAIAFRGRELDILDARVHYGPVELVARGGLRLERHVDTNLLLTIVGNGDGLPYVAQIVPGLRLGAAIRLQGTDERLATSGIAYGDGRAGRLDALFSIDANGNGVVGPISIERADGASLYARVALDRTHDDASGAIDVRHFSLRPAPLPQLPGLRNAHLPAIAATLDAHAAGSLAGGAGGSVRLRSSLGAVDGAVAAEQGTLAFDGRVATSFERLRAITGDVGRGDLAFPLRVVASRVAIAVQVPELRLAHVSVHGVSVRDGSATIVRRGETYEVPGARLGIAEGSVTARGTFGHTNDLYATAALPFQNGRLTAVARVSGTSSDPRAEVGAVVAGARYRGVPLSLDASASYERGRLTLRDLSGVAAGAIVNAHGTLNGLGGRTPAVDLRASVQGAQIATLARAVRAPLRYPDGDIDLDAHATGALASPHVDGELRVARGSINGLHFRDVYATLHGSPDEIAAQGGRVVFGSTAVAFSGAFRRGGGNIALRAPRADLADFNDYFAGSDMLAGHGRIDVDAQIGAVGVRTAGDVALSGARLRAFSVGNIAADWRTTGRTIDGHADVRGGAGAASLAGTMTFPGTDPLRDPMHRSALDANAKLAGLQLGPWLAAAGINVPVLGTVDATAHASGAPGAPAFAADATLRNGVAARYPIDELHVVASGDRRGARINRLTLTAPGVAAAGEGSAGYGAHDPIALALHAQSDDIGVVAKRLGAGIDLHGPASTDVHVSGTRSDPRIAQTVDASNLRSGRLEIPRVHADLVADTRNVTLRTAEADLQRGRVLLAAALPIQIGSGSLLRNAPFAASLRADRIEVAQFEPLMPAGSHAGGTIDGTLTAGGTVGSPQLGGALVLSGGNYSSAFVRSPITNAGARLELLGTQARLSALHADVGGGAIDGAGTATVGDLRDPRRTLVFDTRVAARGARLSLAKTFTGQIDGELRATQDRGRIPLLAGDISVSQARIPLNALLPPSGGTAKTEPFPIAFDLKLTIGSDVRVQSPNVDVGARGRVALAGTLAKPVLGGAVRSTDGTLSFYRNFVLQRGVVAFDRTGIIPNVDATATTEVPDPPTEILLHVSGPATALNLDLASRPNYDRAQILGLLVNAQALGAVRGVQTSGTAGSAPSIDRLAGGFLAQQFTRSLLEPFGGQMGRALGFDSVALGYDFTNGLGAGFTRRLGKRLSGTFHQEFGGGQRQSLALNARLREATSVQLTVFGSASGANRAIGMTSPLAPSAAEPVNYTLEALAPPTGSSGFVMTYQRKYK